MVHVGIWERNEGILAEVRTKLGTTVEGVELLGGSHPADFTSGPLDLLCVSTEAIGWAGLNAVDCRALLLPGVAAPLARGLRCACAVSYGASPKDTLTFSSLEGNRVSVALQRELVTLKGGLVEQQEFSLPFPAGRPPLSFLAVVGVLLFLGIPPEAL